MPANDNCYVIKDGKRNPLPDTWVLYGAVVQTAFGAIGYYGMGEFAYLGGDR